MFGGGDAVLRHLRAVRDPQQYHAGESWRAPLDRRDHGGLGIASTCTMFATSPHTLYILRMLVGIAEAGFLPGILVYLTRWFPAYHRARANALFMIAMPVTMMLGSILSGYILALDGLWNLKGWQWLFLLEGLPSVVLGVVTVLPQRHAG